MTDRAKLIDMLRRAGIDVDESDELGTIVSIVGRNGNEIIFLFAGDESLYAVEAI